MQKLGSLIVLSGPSGVGKSTLVKRVFSALPELEFSISCTTRKPRTGEQNGREYYFLAESDFERRVQAGEFIEYAGIYAHRYGTLKSEVITRLRAGKSVLLDIDSQGAKQIQAAAEKDFELAAALQCILIAPPDLDTLASRLSGRGSETPEQLKLRLDGALNELRAFRLYDYYLINDDLETAAEQLISLIRSFSLRTPLIQGEPF